MKERKTKGRFKERGITLIALVITIIVLLILVGVTLATLIGDSGILRSAEKAKEQYKVAEEKEMEILQQWSDMINDKTNDDSNEGSSGNGTESGDDESSSGDGKEETTISVKDMNVELDNIKELEITLPSSIDKSHLSYESSDTTIVDVFNDGRIYGMKPGKATVSIIHSGETVATCEVTVLGIRINEYDIEMHEGETCQITVTSTIEGDIIYKSSNETIFTVSDTGFIIAKSAGRATLTVTCGGYEDMQRVEIWEGISGGGIIEDDDDFDF